MKILIVTPAFNPPHGGLRVINEWASRLPAFGHQVAVHSLKCDTPGWFTLASSVTLQRTYSAHGVDCLIVCSPHGIHMAESVTRPAKVFLFMQMLEHLFKPGKADWQQLCRRFYLSPHPMICISKWNQRDLRERFARTGPIHYVGNGVNLDHFPIENPPQSADEKTVLIEGWENTNPTKDPARITATVARRLRAEGYRIMAYSHLPLRTSPELVDEYHFMPSLAELNQLYRRATILIKASRYDARACAPLEAMTKGTVTARAIIEGDDDLTQHNSIRVTYDAGALYDAARRLLTDRQLRQRLSANCRAYVRDNCSWDSWMEEINSILISDPPAASAVSAEKPSVKTVVVAIVYRERTWLKTKADIERLDLPTVYVERDPPGTGSLAEAINRGFREACRQYDFKFVWFVTNIRFGPSAVPQLETAIGTNGWSAVHPAFDSDHVFCRKNDSAIGNLPVQAPFIEFTAPLIRRETFRDFPLDETMPYWGHDLDWGMRTHAAGLKLGVDHTCTVEHVYLRRMGAPEPCTRERLAARRATNDETRERLAAKYGPDWRVLTSLDSPAHG